MKKILAAAVAAFLSLTVQPAVAAPPAQCVVAEQGVDLSAAVATGRRLPAAQCAALVAEHQAKDGLIDSIICPILALWFPPEGDVYIVYIVMDEHGNIEYAYVVFWDCPPYNS